MPGGRSQRARPPKVARGAKTKSDPKSARRRPASRACMAVRPRRPAPITPRRRDPREHPDWDALSADQQRAAALVHDTDKSLVIYGPAGTGKSRLIDFIHQISGAPKTAMTACAASLIGGVTLHSLLRWVPDESYYDWCKYTWMVRNALKGANILIVDEAFTLGDTAFARLNLMLRRIAEGDPDRKDRCALPFGGFRLILVGDPLQLPPVEGRPLFTSKAYAELAPEVIMLRHIFRQTAPLYLHLLGALRFGCYTPLAVLTVLLLEHRAEHLVASTNALHLFAVRSLRDQHNFARVQLLGETVQFERSWALGIAGPGYYRIGKRVVHVVGAVADKGRTPPGIPAIFAVGCPVRVTRNIDPAAGLVNGAFGTVVSIQTAKRTVTVRLSDGACHELGDMAVYSRVWLLGDGSELTEDCLVPPLEPAYATTVHGAQGVTRYGALDVDTTHRFVSAAMVYVGASRSRTLADLFPHGLSDAMARVRPNKCALDFLAQNGIDLAAEQDVLMLQSAELLRDFARLAQDEMNLPYDDVARALRAIHAKMCLRMRVTPRAVPWAAFRADFDAVVNRL